MKSSTSNIAVLFTGTLLAGVFSWLLYSDITQDISGARTKQIGTISFKRRVAQRKFSKQVVWHDVQNEAPLYNYDTIRTADLSEAVIILNDKTEIRLEENSMILLAQEKDIVAIDFTRGSIQAKRSGKADTGKVTIAAGGTDISIDDADINLEGNAEEEVKVTVREGNATVQTDEGSKTISSNEQLIATKEKIEIQPVTVTLITPEKGARLPTESEFKSITFTWKLAESENGMATFQLSSDHAFNSLVQQKTTAKDSITINLAPGVYFWRVTAPNSNGDESTSSTRRITVVAMNKPVPLLPRDSQIFTYRSDNPMVGFRWRSDNDAQIILQVSDNPQFTSRRIHQPVASDQISVNSLPEGKWYWRLLARYGNSVETASPVQSFTIQKVEEIAPPVPSHPVSGTVKNLRSIQENKLLFSWQGHRDLSEYEFELARDSRFDNNRSRLRQTGTFLRSSRSNQSGTWYWRVRGLTQDGYITPWSGTVSFRVVQDDQIVPIYPQTGETISSSDALRFSWRPTGLKRPYLLLVSANDRMTSPFLQKTTIETSLSEKGLNEGTYYWKVLQKNDEGETIMESSVRSFTLQTVLAAPVPLSPLRNETVDMTHRSSLDLQWNGVKDATAYSITLVKNENTGRKQILKQETGKTGITITNLTLLSKGNFTLTVEPLEKNRQGKILRRGKVMTIPFTITLQKTLKAPILEIPDTLYVE